MQLRTTQPDSSAGIVMFPTDNLCAVKNTPDVTVQLLDTGHEASISAFLDTVAPEGSTPLAGATILAYDYLHNQLNNPGNKFVVLLTDGAETCKATELPKLLNMDVPNARLVNIRTFVIGVPGSESARALLSQIAFAGGTPRMPGCNHNPAPANQGDCHFDMTTTQNFSADLADALNAISGTVLTCEFDVPSPSQAGTEVDLNKVNVTINGVEVLQDQTRDCNVDAEGWQFIDNNTKIILCGQPCVDAVVPSTRVDIVLGCPTMVTIPA